MRKKIEDEFRNYDNFEDAINGITKICKLPAELKERFKIFRTMVGNIGWEKKEDDITFFIWENIPDSNTIKIADDLAVLLGHEEAYFELREVTFGGGTPFSGYSLTWLIEKTIEWGLGKGLDYLYNKFTNPKVINLTEKLKKESAFEEKNGKLYIKIKPDEKVIFKEIVLEIVGYPNLKTNLKLESIEDLKIKILKNPDCCNYIYTKDGVFKEGSCPDKHFSIEV